MPKVIEVIYEGGVFKPLEKVELRDGQKLKIKIEDVESIVNEAFGLLKGKDTLKALRELEDEWGVC